VALAFGPDGKRLVAGVVAGVGMVRAAQQPLDVRLWRIDLGRQDPTFKPYQIPVPGYFSGAGVHLGFSPDGRYVMLADLMGNLYWLDGRTGAEVRRVALGGRPAASPVFSPDGRSLAVATFQNTGSGSAIRLWEVHSGRVRWERNTAEAGIVSLAFSPDSKILASGYTDSTALLWDLTGERTAFGKPPSLTLDKGWEALNSPDALEAFKAQQALCLAGARALALFRDRIRPVSGKPLDRAALNRLVSQLDDDDFDVRRKAVAALAEQGAVAEEVLARALEGKPSAEVKRQVSDLLERIRRPGIPAELLRPLRALEVAEWIRTAEAKKLIQEWSTGRADALLTREAQASWRRMKERGERE
jgi:dipeptidyl aminopeptidase/acylaminoacyl peptidase